MNILIVQGPKSSNSQLPTPDPVESITRELEYSLDLHSATQGQYVVKPQVILLLL